MTTANSTIATVNTGLATLSNTVAVADTTHKRLIKEMDKYMGIFGHYVHYVNTAGTTLTFGVGGGTLNLVSQTTAGHQLYLNHTGDTNYDSGAVVIVNSGTYSSIYQETVSAYTYMASMYGATNILADIGSTISNMQWYSKGRFVLVL